MRESMIILLARSRVLITVVRNMHRTCSLLGAAMFAAFIAIANLHASVEWTTIGADEDVTALVADGTGNIYAGGNFTEIGGVAASRIAKWNGKAWAPLGAGSTVKVNQLAVDASGKVYATGKLKTPGGVDITGVAMWSGTAWSQLGSGLTDAVNDNITNYSLIVAASNLYVTDGSDIWKWGGSVWEKLPSLPGFVAAGDIKALAFDAKNNVLYAAGFMDDVFSWNGSSWTALDGAADGPGGGVYAAKVDSEGNLYVSGIFPNPSKPDEDGGRVAKWDGTDWSYLSGGVVGNGPVTGTSTIYALATSGTALYVGGNFGNVGGVPANYVAKWGGKEWFPVGSGVASKTGGSDVYALAVSKSGNYLYAGGYFDTAGGKESPYIAKAVIGSAPQITSKASATGTIGKNFTYKIKATNSPSSYSAVGLPPGLRFNPKNGLILGKPTSGGNFDVVISASNDVGKGFADLKIRISVPPDRKKPTIRITSRPVAVQNAYTLRGSASDESALKSAQYRLKHQKGVFGQPVAIQFSGSGKTRSFVPVQADLNKIGVWTFEIKVTDAAGNRAVKIFTVNRTKK